MASAESWPEAWNGWQAVLRLTPKTRYGQMANEELTVARSGLQADLERIKALLVPGRAKQGYAELVDLKQRCAGIPFESELKAEVRRAEANRALREEIAAYKLEREADELLREAQRLFDAGEQKAATLAVRRLLSKRFGATPAAATARELWPALAEEERIKAETPARK
jgi:hypothetical protein